MNKNSLKNIATEVINLEIDALKILKKSINNVGIDYDARSMEKPSDHCPVWLELNE